MNSGTSATHFVLSLLSHLSITCPSYQDKISYSICFAGFNFRLVDAFISKFFFNIAFHYFYILIIIINIMCTKFQSYQEFHICYVKQLLPVLVMMNGR